MVGVPLPGQRGGDRGCKDAVLGLGKFPKQLLPPLVAESVEAVAGEQGFQGPSLPEEVDDLPVGQFGTAIDPLPLRADVAKDAPVLLQERQLHRLSGARRHPLLPPGAVGVGEGDDGDEDRTPADAASQSIEAIAGRPVGCYALRPYADLVPEAPGEEGGPAGDPHPGKQADIHRHRDRQMEQHERRDQGKTELRKKEQRRAEEFDHERRPRQQTCAPSPRSDGVTEHRAMVMDRQCVPDGLARPPNAVAFGQSGREINGRHLECQGPGGDPPARSAPLGRGSFERQKLPPEKEGGEEDVAGIRHWRRAADEAHHHHPGGRRHQREADPGREEQATEPFGNEQPVAPPGGIAPQADRPRPGITDKRADEIGREHPIGSERQGGIGSAAQGVGDENRAEHQAEQCQAAAIECQRAAEERSRATACRRALAAPGGCVGGAGGCHRRLTRGSGQEWGSRGVAVRGGRAFRSVS